MDESWAVQRIIEIAGKLRMAQEGIGVQAGELVTVAERLLDEEMAKPYVDIIEELPVNPDPKHPERWWMRELSHIRGITIHHTLSHNPVNVARYVIEKKGRPTLPYHFWVSTGGECWLCVPLHYGMWHDHTGHRNVNISIGMAGHLHKVKPKPGQLMRTVILVAYLMKEFDIPVEQVQGHKDRYSGTICPGWDAMGWRDWFYSTLKGKLD